MHTLVPGDLIATGTNHGGLHPLMDGDRVELEVGGLGRLSIDIRDDLKRTWNSWGTVSSFIGGRPAFEALIERVSR